MSEGKHTPGPWLVTKEYDHNNDVSWRVSAPLPRIAATATEDEANARLIAAAPDMLEALEGLVSYLDRTCLYEDSGARARIVAVIQKAKGEP